MCVSKIILWPNRMAHASKIKPSIWAVFYWSMLLIPADYPLVVMLPLLKEHEKIVGGCVEYGNGAINPRAQVRNAGNQNLLFYLWCRAINLMQSPRVELIYVWLTIIS